MNARKLPSNRGWVAGRYLRSLVLISLVACALCLATFSLPLATGAESAKRLAVLELTNKAQLTNDEGYYLTDKVRDAASRVLASRGFLIMTQESIYELLPPGTNYEKVCNSSQCEVEVGRQLGADYIITGEILMFAGEFRANLKAHHSGSGAFLGAEVCEGQNLKDLEKSIAHSSLLLFNKVLAHSGAGPITPTGTTVQPGSIGESPTGGWDLPTASQAVVRFESDPPGAVVMADGQLKCQATPCSKAINEGSATVSMQRERYQARQEIVQIKKGMSPITWKLTPNFGWLSVTSNPSGLSVRINGEAAGTTPLQNKELDPGSYEVLVADPRYYDQGERFSLSPGERKSVSVTLAAREGGVQVTARDQHGNDLTGEVFLDGAKVGSAPGSFKAIIGRHNMEVRTSQGSWSGQVEIKERQVTPVAAEVQAAAAPTPVVPDSTSVSSGTGSTATIGYRMVQIPAGRFLMGSPGNEPSRDGDETQHWVTISKGFSLGVTEVTQGQWKRVMGSNPSNFKNCGDDCPVESVSWTDAVEFCNRLSDLEGLSRCYSGQNWDQSCTGYRLPTEAEWEYAARAGTTGPFHTGNCLSTSEANYDGNYPLSGCSKGQYRKTPIRVGSLASNSWGLYDMHGNVWEWVWDWKADYPSGSVTDPVGPSGGSTRVDRGGSWGTSARRTAVLPIAATATPAAASTTWASALPGRYPRHLSPWTLGGAFSCLGP